MEGEPAVSCVVEDTIIAFDSNVLSAFLLANVGKVAQYVGDPLAHERRATYRLFLHCRPFILPSVTVEAGLIPDGVKLEEHLRFIAYSFGEVIPDEHQERLIAGRSAALRKFHNGALDCQIVAEAEIGEVPTLVSLDSKLISRLSPHTTVRLRRPTELWSDLALPAGTPPKWVPGSGHPVEHETWWRW
jgi:hypothetical protein